MGVTAFAQSPVAIFSGACELDYGNGDLRSFSFQVSDGEKAVLGYEGNDEGRYQIQVFSSIGDVKNHFGIAVARDGGGIQNPPTLCQPRPPAYVPHADDAFHLNTDHWIRREFSDGSYINVRRAEGARAVVTTRFGLVGVSCAGVLTAEVF
ncbi:MAG: hypothetical protein KF789_15100 [Bdellovibrionaceae bacterium]|nr:hypothetical protein [Pseudobdellovibrionaceae bacterium]